MLLRRVPDQVKTITADNGTEFHDYESVEEATGVKVTRSGRSTRNELKSTLELIEKVNGKVTGVVLNDVDLKSQPGQYYGRYTY